MTKLLDEFPIGIADYLADTQHLSTIQHGAYLLLMMTMRRHGAWLPNDEAKLARIVKLSVPKWRQIAPDIMALLIVKDGKITQKRVLSDVEKQLNLVTQNRVNGAAGGRAKALKNNEAKIADAKDALAQRQHSEDSALTNVVDTSGDSDSKKKVRAKSDKGQRLPADWKPTEAHYAKGLEYGFDRGRVNFFADRMRNWAGANGHRAVARKSNWDQAFHNWLSDKAERTDQNAPTQTTFIVGKGSYASAAARVKFGSPRPEPERPAPEDLEPINGRRHS